MQKVGDVNWIDDQIATLKLNIDYHYRAIKNIENEIVVLRQHRADQAAPYNVEWAEPLIDFKNVPF